MTQVTKRDGTKEDLNLDKIHAMVGIACEGITGVAPSQVEVNANLQFYDGIKTTDIQEVLIKSAADLISLDAPNYQYVAARLRLIQLRKEVWGGLEPESLQATLDRNIEAKVYDKQFLDWYSPTEIAKLESFIKHDRDYDFTYAGIQQVCDKYLVQNRRTKEKYETPQTMYIMIAATLFKGYPQETRLDFVKKYYDAISTFKLSLPTPIIAGVRTPVRQYASCVLAEIDDTLDSIYSTNHAIGLYVSQRAGIGINSGAIRSEGSMVRGGEVKHTGVIPFLRMLQATTKSCTQNGIRGGASTNHFPFWHKDVQDFIYLKNNQGTEETRVRHMDHCVQLCGLFYKRVIAGEDISLFCPGDVPDLYKNWWSEDWDSLYEQYEADSSIPRKVVRAAELFDEIVAERVETGRLYIMNIDHCNTHSHSKLLINMSNLCQEVLLPTHPIQSIEDEKGRIATCILSAVNVGVTKFEEYPAICELAVRGLDALIDHQEYPVKAAEIYTKEQRSLGVGVINFAYFLAKHKVSWDSLEAYQLTHQMAEKLQYNLLQASVKLAQEKGVPRGYGSTKYALRQLPIDTYKEKVDSVAKCPLTEDWEGLRRKIRDNGLRNVCVSALMPAESSALVSNATNGVEPPRHYISIKGSKANRVPQVVPEYQKLKNFYELLWDMKSPRPYLNHMGIIQKFIDQSISTNTSYNPKNFEDGQMSLDVINKDILYAYSLGIKTLYYNNTNDESDEAEEDNNCESGACAI